MWPAGADAAVIDASVATCSLSASVTLGTDEPGRIYGRVAIMSNATLATSMLRLPPYLFLGGPDAWTGRLQGSPEQSQEFEMPTGADEVLHSSAL